MLSRISLQQPYIEDGSPNPRFHSLDLSIRQNRNRQDALIEVLHRAQEQFGYLEKNVLTYIARELKLPLSRVYGVATFYHLFSIQPKCKHTCSICLGTACYTKGGQALLDVLTKELYLKAGARSPNGKVFLRVERCIGNCGVAPAAIYDGHVSRQQSPEDVLAMVKGWMEEA
ncbi:MAG: bidirectional hydrogenase complex protein HoxE [Pseudanabaena sp.]